MLVSVALWLAIQLSNIWIKHLVFAKSDRALDEQIKTIKHRREEPCELNQRRIVLWTRRRHGRNYSVNEFHSIGRP